MSAPQSEFAPAKVNLTLRLIGRRADGYHLLDSLVAFADLGDRIAWQAAESLSLTLSGPQASALAAAGGGGSVLKAARALAEALGSAPRGTLHLDKHLPVAAGIGGGTADAAATLRLLARIWPGAGAVDLAALAPGLGADVPVCLAARPMRMQGIGEVLTPLDLPDLPVVLVNPGVAVPTAAVFAARQGAFSSPFTVGALPDIAAVAQAVREGGNDLTSPAQEVAPVIGTVLAALRGQGSCLAAAMSGSGATCFGLFPDPVTAQMAANAIASAQPDWWCKAGLLRGA